MSVQLQFAQDNGVQRENHVPGASSPMREVVHAVDELMVFMTFIEIDSVSL